MKRKILLLTIYSLLAFKGQALKPVKEYIQTPKQLGLDFIEKNVLTSDGFTINTWILKTKEPPAKVVVLCYGDAGNKSYFLTYAKDLVKKNIAVVLFDYRGFGGSSDFKINPDYLFYNEFLLDYEAVIQEAKKSFPQSKIGVLCFSMGGYFPLVSNNKIDFYVADSPLLSPVNTLARIKAVKNMFLPEGNLYSVSIDQIKGLVIYFASKDKNIKKEDLTPILQPKKKNQHLKIVNYSGTHCSYINNSLNQIVNDIISH